MKQSRKSIILTCLVYTLLLSYCNNDNITNTTTEDDNTKVIQPGKWSATAFFGEFDFWVNTESTHITRIFIIFFNFQCGEFKSSGSFSAQNDPGWPITDGHFEIGLDLNPDPSFVRPLTILGTFKVDSIEANGKWDLITDIGTCSGVWEAVPSVE